MRSFANPYRPVVVTGVGAITPVGLDAESFWQSLLAGRSGIRTIEAFDAASLPCRIAGEAWGFDPTNWMSPKEVGRSARFVQLAVASAQQAVDGSDLDAGTRTRMRLAVVWGCGSGGAPAMHELLAPLLERGRWNFAEPLALLKVLPDSAATALAMRFGSHAYVTTIAAGCVSSTMAIAHAVWLIRSGVADAAIAGGSEAWITSLGIGSFSLLHALSTSRNHAPAQASRPFDRLRDGFVPAEGAGALVLEGTEKAMARGARPLAEIAGIGVTNDAQHQVAPRDDGVEAAHAIRLALEDAGLMGPDIGYVNAHGTSTPLNDVAETRALKLALGEHAYHVPVSATKSMTGHGLGASGAWETIATVLSIRDSVIHPTINLEDPDPECDLDYVPGQARRVHVRAALKTSFGFGGQNVALLLTPPD